MTNVLHGTLTIVAGPFANYTKELENHDSATFILLKESFQFQVRASSNVYFQFQVRAAALNMFLVQVIAAAIFYVLDPW